MSHDPKEDKRSEFEKAARKESPSLLAEFWGFLKESKKWWLIPLLLALLLIGALVILAGSGLAPFLYPIF